MHRRKIGLGLAALVATAGVLAGTTGAAAQTRPAPDGWEWVSSSSDGYRTVDLWQQSGQPTFYATVNGSTVAGDKIYMSFIYAGGSGYNLAGFSSVTYFGQAVGSPAWTDPHGFSNCGDYVRGHLAKFGGGSIDTPPVSVCS